MVLLILGMLVCVGLALAVVAVVAVPARREGRDLLTPQGEELVAIVKEKTESTIDKTVDKTGDMLAATKEKVTDRVSSIGQSPEDEVHGRAS